MESKFMDMPFHEQVQRVSNEPKIATELIVCQFSLIDNLKKQIDNLKTMLMVQEERIKLYSKRDSHSDPVDVHDAMSKGFSNIEKTIREESAIMSEIIRQAINKEHEND